MEIVTAIVTPVVESLMVPIKKHTGYVIYYTKYVSDMCTKKSDLEATRLGVENHVERNKINNFEVPTEVEYWLEKVAKIDAQVESILANVVSCFNIKLKHKLGRKAFKITEEINHFIQENSTINWTDHPIPLGKVNSMRVCTYTPPSDHNDFKSRERTFMEALKALQPDHKSRMIALCGMGGVGKTTMMEKLKKAAEENKLFNLIVKVVIGEKMNTIAIQDAVADYLGISLTEKSESARSDRLRKSFEAYSNGGEKKILVILDDVWKLVRLNDMGLSPLPNQGIGFKFLLTSRDRSVCTMIMGVESSIFKVDVIEESEARSFFQQYVELSNDDRELHKIGEDIVTRCHGLPIAIKTLAITLKDKSKNAWRDALFRLEHHDINQVVHEVFGMSYKNLQDEEIKSIFLLCGLFPEDFDIPIEDLLRYGWGLELFNKVYRITNARNRLNTCIERLIHANLLIQSQKVGCAKMHDLVREFVLDLCSKGEHMSIVGNMSNLPAQLMTDSCKRISLTCTGMSELPGNFKFPNLSLLKLMHGDDSLKFPKDFYEDMKNLQVIAYDKMKNPSLCRSLQCSTNLRTLCLHECLSMFDFSSIGDLLNLEVLSFAHCGIKKLPSTIKNLKKLKLLDLTGCHDLCIDDGVLINLVNLEELNMKTYKASAITQKGISFTHANREELVECSNNLTSLEIEFFDSDLPKNMSLKKLERFQISLGCNLEDELYELGVNTLKLVTNKRELLDSRMNELFEKTELLYLQIDGMNDLGEILVGSLDHHRSSFCNLTGLIISKCANLRYLFTINVANGLTKLKLLALNKCAFLETLVDNKNGGIEAIKFHALESLILEDLPKLMSLCNDVNAIELPKLEELVLEGLPNFTSICANGKSNHNSTMQPLLNKEVVISRLKKLQIVNMEKEISVRSNEEIIQVGDTVSNVVVPSYLIHNFRHLHTISIKNCKQVDAVFEIEIASSGKLEDITLQALKDLRLESMECMSHVWKCNWNKFLIRHSQQPQGFSSSFHNLTTITLWSCKNVKYLFSPLMAKLLSNLKKIEIRECDLIEEVVSDRDDEDEGTSAFTSTNTSTNLFPHLEYIIIGYLPNLKRIGGANISLTNTNTAASVHDQYKFSQVDAVPRWYLCQYFREISIWNCDALSSVVPWYAVGQMQKLEEIQIFKCKSLLEVFESAGGCCSSSSTTLAIPSLKYIHVPQLSNLKTLRIETCDRLEHVFAFSALESLMQLQELIIINCKTVKVIVKEEDPDQATMMPFKVVVFPRLKSIQLQDLPNLKGFFLGTNTFHLPMLDAFAICRCPQMRVLITSGHLIAPKLNFHSRSYSLQHGLDNFVYRSHEESAMAVVRSLSFS